LIWHVDGIHTSEYTTLPVRTPRFVLEERVRRNGICGEYCPYTWSITEQSSIIRGKYGAQNHRPVRAHETTWTIATPPALFLFARSLPFFVAVSGRRL